MAVQDLTSVQGDRLQALLWVSAGRACALERNAARKQDVPGAGQKVQEGGAYKVLGGGTGGAGGLEAPGLRPAPPAGEGADHGRPQAGGRPD